MGVRNRASNSRASYSNRGYHPCLRGEDCILFSSKYRFGRNSALKNTIWNCRKLPKITAMCSLLFDFLCFRSKLFQENRILRSKSKSIKQKPGIKRPLAMFLKMGAVHRLSRSPENQNSWSQVTDVRARAPQAMACPRVKNFRRVPLLDHEEPGL